MLYMAECFTKRGSQMNTIHREVHRWEFTQERSQLNALHRKGHSWILYTEMVTARILHRDGRAERSEQSGSLLSPLHDGVIARYFTQTWSHLNTLHRDDHRWVFIQTVSNSWMCAHREWHSWILYALRVTQLNTLHTESNTAEYFTHRE